MVNDDGNMFEINEKHNPNGMKWSEFKTDKNINMKMEFWWNVTEQAQCPIARAKALVSTLISHSETISIEYLINLISVNALFASEKRLRRIHVSSRT